MLELVESYSGAALALGAMAVVMLVQVLIADVVGIRRRHLPGSPVAADHADALFRVTRTVANTNESIAIFLAALLFCMLNGADPGHTTYGAWAFVASRIAYAACYYANVQLLRSVCFGLSLLSLLAILIIGARAL